MALYDRRETRCGSILFAAILVWPPVALAEDSILDLLRSTLVVVRSEEGAPSDTVARFESNMAYRPQANTWSASMPSSPVDVKEKGYSLHINQRLNQYTGNQSDPPFNIQTNIQSSASETVSTLSAINSGYESVIFGTPGYRLSSRFVIAACQFDFVSRANCYPLVRLKNLSAQQPVRVTFSVLQGANTPRMLDPDQEILLDRSEGEIVVSFDNLIAKTPPTIRLQVNLHEGENTSIAPGLSHADRMLTYRRLSQLQRSLTEAQQTSADAASRARVKSLTTSIRIISALAVQEKYPDIVLELLKARARDISEINDQVVALRKLVLANGIATTADIEATVTKIDYLLLDPGVGQVDTLQKIREELIRAAAAAADQNGAIAVIRDKIVSSVDRLFEEYQLLVLEYAQFVPSEKLGHVLDSSTRGAVLAKVLWSDVRIGDEAQSGKGVAIRTAFGLPNPK